LEAKYLGKGGLTQKTNTAGKKKRKWGDSLNSMRRRGNEKRNLRFPEGFLHVPGDLSARGARGVKIKTLQAKTTGAGGRWGQGGYPGKMVTLWRLS